MAAFTIAIGADASRSLRRISSGRAVAGTGRVGDGEETKGKSIQGWADHYGCWGPVKKLQADDDIAVSSGGAVGWGAVSFAAPFFMRMLPG
jgi:hypothetical protein